MTQSWPVVKEIFFFIGSLAGFIAFFRPIFDQKHARDLERARYILASIPEQVAITLKNRIDLRMIPESMFIPFAHLEHESMNNHELLRFSGPLKKIFQHELSEITSEYRNLRNLIQVPEWERIPTGSVESTENYWCLNNSIFSWKECLKNDRDKHIDECFYHAQAILNAYQRLQITTETHLFEIILAKWLLPKRYANHGVEKGSYYSTH